MILIDILLTIAIISLSCLGLRTLMSDGQILHFIRKPYENRKRPPVYLKPLILCVICFSSVWGGSVFIALHGITLADAPYLIIACVSSSFVIKIVNDHVEF